MIFTDIAKYIFDTQQPLDHDLLDYMQNYGAKFWNPQGNGSYYDWFLKHGTVPTGTWLEDVHKAEAIELQKRQRQANDDAMANAFGDMRVHSRLPTVIPRSRTVRDVVGRLAESKALARSSAPQARRGGGRSRLSKR